MTDPHEAALDRLVHDAFRSARNEVGRFRPKNVEAVLDEVLSRPDLPEGVRAAARRRLAKSLVRSEGEKRNPRRRKRGKRSTMYDPDDYLRLGGEWVEMRDATDTDLAQWARNSATNADRVVAADAETQDYAADRIDAYRAHPGLFRNLDELERGLYGWSEQPDLFTDHEPDGE